MLINPLFSSKNSNLFFYFKKAAEQPPAIFPPKKTVGAPEPHLPSFRFNGNSEPSSTGLPARHCLSLPSSSVLLPDHSPASFPGWQPAAPGRSSPHTLCPPVHVPEVKRSCPAPALFAIHILHLRPLFFPALSLETRFQSTIAQSIGGGSMTG